VPGFRVVEISTLINLLLDCVALGRLEEAETYLAEVQRDLGRPEFGAHNWRWRTRLAEARARLALARGEVAAAEAAIAEMLGWAERTASRKYQARGWLLRAELCAARGDASGAAADLRAAQALADSLGDFPTRVRARLRLADVWGELGEPAAATQAGREAGQLIAQLAGRLQNPELRRSYERGLARLTAPVLTPA
jgi:tetratricopeptide (TPR) repeat protein